MKESLELRSRNLILRQTLPSDAEAIRSYRSLPEVARFQSWESYSLSDAEKLLDEQKNLKPDTSGIWLQLAIVEANTRSVIGDCGIHFCADDSRQVEIGITLSPSSQGKGLATETLKCVLDYLFGTLGKHRVFAITDTRNTAAANLFKRVGFRQEAHFMEHVWFKGAYGSEYLFALLKQEWPRS